MIICSIQYDGNNKLKIAINSSVTCDSSRKTPVVYREKVFNLELKIELLIDGKSGENDTCIKK